MKCLKTINLTKMKCLKISFFIRLKHLNDTFDLNKIPLMTDSKKIYASKRGRP